MCICLTYTWSNMQWKEQFSKYANLFFLFTACIQQIPDVSPTNRYTTIAPLAVVLLASAFKEVQEDMVRSLLHFLILSLTSNSQLRNDINPTQSSTRAKPKSSLPNLPFKTRSGKTFKSATSSVLRAMTLFRLI